MNQFTNFTTKQVPHQIQSIHHQFPINGLTLGKFPINRFLIAFIPLCIFAPLFSYFTAVSKTQARGYPHTTITNMSRFYPQDLVFRYLMLSAGGFISLIYFVIFKWIRKLKQQTQYPGSTEQWLLKWGQISIIGYYCAVATIDGGNLPNLHIFGALFFFIMQFLISVIISFVLKDMHEWSSSITSRQNVLIKMGIAIYLIAVCVYSIIGGIFEAIPTNDDDQYIVIFQWNLVLGTLVWLATFAGEWGNIFIVLKDDTKMEKNSMKNQCRKYNNCKYPTY